MSLINRPCLDVFINSLRDIGYSCQSAIADLLDNSISAGAKRIKVYAIRSKNSLFVVDDGTGMNQEELVEAMRLGTKHEERADTDLGRFGLGLKTASFSQCKKLTLISNKDGCISGYCWDLDLLAEKNDWEMEEVSLPRIESLLSETDPSIWTDFASKDGTIVLWENIDRYDAEQFNSVFSDVSKHLSLVFHKYLSSSGFSGHRVEIFFNNEKLKPFDPFASKDNKVNRSSQTGKTESFVLSDGNKMDITYHVLPPLSKLSKAEYEELGTLEGFTRSQGFYLYRQGRLLVYGTWFGLAKINDASNLVRVEIEIDNKQDSLWHIDVKKSTAFPNSEIRGKLKHYVNNPIKRSRGVYQNGGTAVIDEKSAYWVETINPSGIKMNQDNPRYKELMSSLDSTQQRMLNSYLNCLQNCYPKERLYNIMVVNPSDIKDSQVSTEILEEDIKLYKAHGFDREKTKGILLMDEYYASSETLVDEYLEKYYD